MKLNGIAKFQISPNRKRKHLTENTVYYRRFRKTTRISSKKNKVESCVTLSHTKYLFWEGKTTIEVVKVIIRNTSHKLPAMICIDVNNAFNTAK